jgi:hypothetical protein
MQICSYMHYEPVLENKKGQPEKENQEEQSGTDSQDRTAKIGLLGQDFQDGTVRAEQPRWDCQDGTGRDCQDGTARTGQDVTARKGQPRQDC